MLFTTGDCNPLYGVLVALEYGTTPMPFQRTLFDEIIVIIFF